MKKLVLACLIIGSSFSVVGQDSLRSELDPDAVFLKSDTLPITSYASNYDPRKAILLQPCCRD